VPINEVVKSVNLLPADLRGTEFSADSPAGPKGAGSTGAWFVLGALALAVLALAGSVLASNTVEQRRAELAEVTASQAGTRQQVAALKPYADFRDKAEGRVASVRQLAGSRFDWERALRDISRTLPASVTLDTIDASLDPSASESTSPLRGAIKAPAVQLTGCTTDQRQVARMMARLRGVQGVTRVSLSDSAKADEQGGASESGAAAVGSGTEQPPCGPGSHPSFDIVMFFERDAALSAAPNVQEAPATGGQSPSGTAGSSGSSSASGAPSSTAPSSTAASPAGSNP
jgi:Tfp pilus assembly protein PilN